jgi:hypothetical protein
MSSSSVSLFFNKFFQGGGIIMNIFRKLFLGLIISAALTSGVAFGMDAMDAAAGDGPDPNQVDEVIDEAMAPLIAAAHGSGFTAQDLAGGGDVVEGDAAAGGNDQHNIVDSIIRTIASEENIKLALRRIYRTKFLPGFLLALTERRVENEYEKVKDGAAASLSCKSRLSLDCWRVIFCFLPMKDLSTLSCCCRDSGRLLSFHREIAGELREAAEAGPGIVALVMHLAKDRKIDLLRILCCTPPGVDGLLPASAGGVIVPESFNFQQGQFVINRAACLAAAVAVLCPTEFHDRRVHDACDGMILASVCAVPGGRMLHSRRNDRLREVHRRILVVSNFNFYLVLGILQWNDNFRSLSDWDKRRLILFFIGGEFGVEHGHVGRYLHDLCIERGLLRAQDLDAFFKADGIDEEVARYVAHVVPRLMEASGPVEEEGVADDLSCLKKDHDRDFWQPLKKRLKVAGVVAFVFLPALAKSGVGE